MKFLIPLCTLAFLLSAFNVGAHVGCNIGTQIYPNPTGGVNSVGDPYYYNSNPITIRWWDGDPNCGIMNNKISYRTNGDDNCQIFGTNTWGIMYYYNPKDNNCIPLPLDDYLWVILPTVAVTGAYFLRDRYGES